MNIFLTVATVLCIIYIFWDGDDGDVTPLYDDEYWNKLTRTYGHTRTSIG